MGVPTIIISEPNSHRNSMFKKIIDKEFICDISNIEINTLEVKIDKLIETDSISREDILVKIEKIKNRSLENGKYLSEILFNV